MMNEELYHYGVKGMKWHQHIKAGRMKPRNNGNGNRMRTMKVAELVKNNTISGRINRGKEEVKKHLSEKYKGTTIELIINERTYKGSTLEHLVNTFMDSDFRKKVVKRITTHKRYKMPNVSDIKLVPLPKISK